jgi:hypothetical protein
MPKLYHYVRTAADDPEAHVQSLYLTAKELLERLPWLQPLTPFGLDFCLEVTQDLTYTRVWDSELSREVLR